MVVETVVEPTPERPDGLRVEVTLEDEAAGSLREGLLDALARAREEREVPTGG